MQRLGLKPWFSRDFIKFLSTNTKTRFQDNVSQKVYLENNKLYTFSGNIYVILISSKAPKSFL